MNKRIKIDIVSDFACPWCYVGKKRLKKALKLRPDIEVEINWKPYQLNPDIAAEGKNRNLYYQDKFGADQFKVMLNNLKQVGLGEGINFCDSDSAVAPNTLAAHRLMFWASQDESINSNALQDKLFKAHHEECENIGSFDVLLDIAEEAGMDKTILREKFNKGEDEELVKKMVEDSYNIGASGVPFYIINDKYTISGAQEAEYLLSAFDQIAAMKEEGNSN